MKRKTSMSYLDLLSWIRNSGEELKGSTINNIYYKDGLLWMKLKKRGAGTVVLIAEPGRRVHLTESPPEAPERLHPFAGGLRKYIKGSRVIDVRTVGYDRVLNLELGRGDERYKLIVELVPRGVALLTDKDDVILYANEYKEMRDRVIKRKEKYVPPPSPNFDPFNDLENLDERIKKGKDVVRGLIIGQKLPADFAEEVLFRAGIEKSKKPKDLTPEELDRIKQKIKEVFNESMEGTFYLAYKERPFAFMPFEPTLLEAEGYKIEKDQPDKVLDKYFSTLEVEETEESVEEMISREKERIMKSIEEQRKLAEQYKQLSEEYAALATEIASNLYEYEEMLKKEGVIKIKDKELKVPRGKSLDEYVRDLFAKSKEYEKKYKRALKALEELQKELERVEEKIKREMAKERAKHRKKEWYEKYHWIITRNEFLAIGGKDASQNESVVRRYLEDEDIFMHAEVQGAPAVVLKLEGREPSEEDLRDAACITACYSKAWKDGRASVDVFYVKGSQVSKTPPSGQYVAKGAFIIRGKREYVKDIPLRLGIGVELYEGAPRIIVGPPELVARRSIVYAILAPGDTEKRKVAERLKKLWISKVSDPELQGLIEGIKEDEIVQRIPGKASILKVSVGAHEEVGKRASVQR